MIVLMAGLPGTGKSTLARALAARLNGVVLDKDRLRAALFAPADIEYSAGQDDFCVHLLLETAAWLLRKNQERHIFVDGRTFSRGAQIEAAIHAVEEMGSEWRILECVCSDATARQRLSADVLSGNHPAANRDFNLYQEVKRSWEPILRPHTVIDTDTPLEECVQRAISEITGTNRQR